LTRVEDDVHGILFSDSPRRCLSRRLTNRRGAAPGQHECSKTVTRVHRTSPKGPRFGAAAAGLGV